MRSSKFLILTLATCAVALSACGDSKDKGPSKADYIASADKICAADGKAIDAASANITQDSTPEEFAAFQAVLVPAMKAEIKTLRALKTPSGDKDTLAAIYDAVEAGADKIAAADPADLATVLSSDPFGEANKKGKAYGFKQCGE